MLFHRRNHSGVNGGKKHAISLGLTPEKLHVVANGITRQVTRSREEARRQLLLDNDKLYIGFIGRLVSQKDPALQQMITGQDACVGVNVDQSTGFAINPEKMKDARLHPVSDTVGLLEVLF